VSAEIIPFTRGPRRHCGRADIPAFGSTKRPDDLAMDHADTAPCECARPEVQPREFGDG
jgi:hypothetical protein